MSSPTAPAKPRDWSPRFWECADFFAWHRILFRNRLAVGPAYAYIAAIVGCNTFIHTLLRWLQGGMYGHRIARTAVKPPVFVIGHWRTGTTLLHELLTLNPKFGSPTTLHCFDPCAFVLTERFMKRYVWFGIPEKRPMDNMAAGWDRPQEDEFALALLGAPSPYTDCAFPNREPLDPGSLDLSGLTPGQLRAWKRTLLHFLRTVQYVDPRPLVLKSPPHTARIRVLLELFPDAKFVHIVRDPYVVFPSTMNLWTAFNRKHGFQRPRSPHLVKAKVLREFRTLYERFFADKPLIPAGQYTEVRYEDLIADMTGEVGRVYRELNLGDWEAARPKVEAFVAANRHYERNKWLLSDAERDEVREAWGDIIEKLGYGERPA